MARVFASSVIPAPVEEVWALVRDFDALPAWHPAVADSRIEDGGSGDRVGCVRVLRLSDGGTIRERLLALSDRKRLCTSSILGSPLPLQNHVATLRLRPVTDRGHTFAEWTAEFDCAPEDEAALAHGIGGTLFQGGFDALKERFGGVVVEWPRPLTAR